MKSSVHKSNDSFGMYVRSYSASEREENSPDGNTFFCLDFWTDSLRMYWIKV